MTSPQSIYLVTVWHEGLGDSDAPLLFSFADKETANAFMAQAGDRLCDKDVTAITDIHSMPVHANADAALAAMFEEFNAGEA